MMAEAEAEEASGGLAGEVEEAARMNPGPNCVLCTTRFAAMSLLSWSTRWLGNLHSSPSPHNVDIKALQTSAVRGEHRCRHQEFEDRGLATIKDGYTPNQILDMI